MTEVLLYPTQIALVLLFVTGCFLVTILVFERADGATNIILHLKLLAALNWVTNPRKISQPPNRNSFLSTFLTSQNHMNSKVGLRLRSHSLAGSTHQWTKAPNQLLCPKPSLAE
jgi:hypothetical protein